MEALYSLVQRRPLFALTSAYVVFNMAINTLKRRMTVKMVKSWRAIGMVHDMYFQNTSQTVKSLTTQ